MVYLELEIQVLLNKYTELKTSRLSLGEMRQTGNISFQRILWCNISKTQHHITMLGEQQDLSQGQDSFPVSALPIT